MPPPHKRVVARVTLTILSNAIAALLILWFATVTIHHPPSIEPIAGPQVATASRALHALSTERLAVQQHKTTLHSPGRSTEPAAKMPGAVPLTYGAPRYNCSKWRGRPELVHVVFSTDCGSFQGWQSQVGSVWWPRYMPAHKKDDVSLNDGLLFIFRFPSLLSCHRRQFFTRRAWSVTKAL